MPVEAIIKIYTEVNVEERMLSIEEAEAKAKAVALAKIRSRLTPDARIRTENVYRIPGGQVDQVQVKVVVEVLENIAEPRDFYLESFTPERGQEFEPDEGGQDYSNQ